MAVPFCVPWRSVWVPRVFTAVALAVGLPLFLQSPPWCDITLYQMAARNLLNGGVHYRDLFDTNLPGFVWAMTALSAVFGPSAVAVRATDLVVVLGVVLLIDRLAKWGGASLAARWWAFAGAALFYPFTVEMSHAQRDTWMALPGLAAVVLRVRRGMGRPEAEPPRPVTAAPLPNATATRSPFWRSFYEGLLWGAGVWMKPHLALIAAAAWVLAARRLAGENRRPWRAAGADALGNLLGGLAAGAPGVVWLVASGAWNPFLDVFLNWNTGYMRNVRGEIDDRLELELHWFPPWSLGLLLTVPLALLSVLDAAPWSSRRAAVAPPRPGPVGYRLPGVLWDKRADGDARFVRGTFAGLYLVWVAQALFLQRGYMYAHVPETLLMFGLWAMHRWAWVPVVVLWVGVTSGLWAAADLSPALKRGLDRATAGLADALIPADKYQDLGDPPTVQLAHERLARERFLPRHPLTDWERVRLWPECWRLNAPAAERYALRDRLRLHPPHEASIGWAELAEVADFLRARGVKDGELIAWFDSPHAVYLILDLEPGFRFMHVFTALSIPAGDDLTGRSGRERVMDELTRAAGAKYVITDLEWNALGAREDEDLRRPFFGPPRSPPGHLLPERVPFPHEFPWNQPTIFRSRGGNGRYVVHLIVTPADSPPAKR
jgi:hypothetical protein